MKGYINKMVLLLLMLDTFIHETGHVLGLDDYYNYDENSTYGAAGKN